MMGAVDFRHHDLVRWLLGLGADANAKADRQSHQSALHSAAWNGDLEMVRLLVESGADIHVRDAQYDAPPIGWAATSVTVTNNPNCAEVVAYLQYLV
jgi:ankyrin repeat protein